MLKTLKNQIKRYFKVYQNFKQKPCESNVIGWPINRAVSFAF